MIRNFCIIAHIDHGKSTLADRMLEITHTLKRNAKSQSLDTMELEQERGITIKLTPARMHRKGIELNLIDTPGHADFQYEVSRSLAAVEGVVLLIDASQGIQAQTLSTLYMAMERDITIIPVLNKIDLPAANPEKVSQEVVKLLGVDKNEIICVSGKTGKNVDLLMDVIVEKIPSPSYAPKFDNEPAKALVFDSVYDKFKGVVCYVKIVSGEFRSHQDMYLLHSETKISCTELGFLDPVYNQDKILKQGQIGYIVTGEKSVRDAQIGDTIILSKNNLSSLIKDKNDVKKFAIPGFKKMKTFVYAGVYPVQTTDYDKLKDCFGKLVLNDSAVSYEHENSNALGFGFRCGFLGMLHMNIIKERLEREYNLETIFTTPTVPYLVKLHSSKNKGDFTESQHSALFTSGLWKQALQLQDISFDTSDLSPDEIVAHYEKHLDKRFVVTSGGNMQNFGLVDSVYEPSAFVEIVGPNDFAGNIMTLCQEYRGNLVHMEYLDEQRVIWKYKMPVGEIIIDFNDRLKSITKGYATMNYEMHSYEVSDLVTMNILLNNETIEAFSLIVHKSKAYLMGKGICERLKELIPRHLFAIPIQATMGNKIIARETIPAIRKDVIAKCYGGDVSRKKKLLQKQKEGKKKMKAMGNVSVPSDVFIKMVAKEV